MKILSFDTANNSASVAISENNNILTYVEENRASMQAETIMPMIEKALQNIKCSYQDIDYLAVTNGPGSFTGIRIGLSAAKGILFASKIKAIGVSNFEYAHFRAKQQIQIYDKIYIFLNAYREQLYCAIFDKMDNMEPPTLINYEFAIKLLSKEQGIIICAGSGLEFIYPSLKCLSNLIILPRFAKVKAWVICRLITDKLTRKEILNHNLEPLYIRPPDAKKPLKTY